MLRADPNQLDINKLKKNALDFLDCEIRECVNDEFPLKMTSLRTLILIYDAICGSTLTDEIVIKNAIVMDCSGLGCPLINALLAIGARFTEDDVIFARTSGRYEMSKLIEHKGLDKIDFRVEFDSHIPGQFYDCDWYIRTSKTLSEVELGQLKEILSFFPHSNINKSEWAMRFAKFKPEEYSNDLIYLAANAYDSNGNTVLGIAAECGDKLLEMGRLLNFGADIDQVDDRSHKTALHWAVANQNAMTSPQRESFDAYESVEFLLMRGADIHIQSYKEQTIIEYAESRDFKGALHVFDRFISGEGKQNDFATLFGIHDAIRMDIHDLLQKLKRGNLFVPGKEIPEDLLAIQSCLKDMKKINNNSRPKYKEIFEKIVNLAPNDHIESEASIGVYICDATREFMPLIEEQLLNNIWLRSNY